MSKLILFVFTVSLVLTLSPIHNAYAEGWEMPTIVPTKDTVDSTKIIPNSVSGSDLTDPLRITQDAYFTGAITASETYSASYHQTASELGKNVTHPPVVDNYGVCKVAKFSVGTDICYYKLKVPKDYASGNITIRIGWTRSTTGSDESDKTVKWQVKNLVVTGGEEVASGENTDSIQDSYTSSSTTDKLLHMTDVMTIAAAEFAIGELILCEIMAVTVDSGTALSEPALIGVGFFYTAYKIVQ